ncbi:UDP-N-acetyl-D-mannosamine dehydrogenase [Winogradskyella aurantiaca]|uniref:UDP-N-acetyl-D-mannosamine dehydrogenase n=1 Tax=Winogradskyella aurantiaca TaxID=2219558 RepID=UPI000E1D07D5|nr:UDP-N-acetyl-D-mannosamine dehydrogenase [Winogradskyella aurantiaca]
MIVSVVGLGYIGLPTAALLASNNIQVFGMDVNEKVVDTINKGQIHIVETDLLQHVQTSVANKLLEANTFIKMADVYLVVVPTPFVNNFEPDISFVQNAVEAIIPLLKEDDLVIIESTSPVGTTDKMLQLILESRPELNGSIKMAYCPERVLPGNIMEELVNNDRVIGGVDNTSTERAMSFYSKFVKGELFGTNARTAEMCKLVENASRDSQIAFANELSIICDKANINVWELIRLANKHPRVNILNPGCGVGGHCIAVDPYFIVSEFPFESQIIAKAREVNNYKAFWVAEKIQNAILQYRIDNGIKPKVALMGLAFKPNIDDLRESPAKYVAQKILQNTNNEDEIYFVEPNITSHSVFKLTPYQQAFDKADIVAYLVAHNEFRNLENNTTTKVVLDFCGVSQ